MELIKSINLMEDKKILKRLNIAAVVLMILFYEFFSIMSGLFITRATDISLTALEMLALGISFFLIIPIHELIHGLFFKLFNLNGKVVFGFKNGMAYATSPNSYYFKWQFFIIGIAPFIIINGSLFILYALQVIPYFFFIPLISIHSGCCVGDFYWAWLLIKAPKNSFVEDTEVGLSFYKKIAN